MYRKLCGIECTDKIKCLIDNNKIAGSIKT